ncbi:MAG: deoxyribodipyrimidine photolyase, partial [Planctomycetota bacterium]
VHDPLHNVDLPTLRSLPERFASHWQASDLDHLLCHDGLDHIPIDHDVKPSPIAGGHASAQQRLKKFLGGMIDVYDEDRNQPDLDGSSQLSAHLHFGHISAQQIVHELFENDSWTTDQMASQANGKNHSFWNASKGVEAYLDQILTWREIGFNMAWRHPDTYDRFDALPEWALKTIDEHAADDRPQIYSLQQFENAETHDELWNAAQRQLTSVGIIHNYMRMLWGKKILHWTASARDAFDIMVHLNNKYALDGRDPNSYSGIMWVLGRYDRAWGPEREIFGKLRYMTSDSTRKKVKLKKYLQRFSKHPAGLFGESS